jgi:hypothetical protein
MAKITDFQKIKILSYVLMIFWVLLPRIIHSGSPANSTNFIFGFVFFTFCFTIPNIELPLGVITVLLGIASIVLDILSNHILYGLSFVLLLDFLPVVAGIILLLSLKYKRKVISSSTSPPT